MQAHVELVGGLAGFLTTLAFLPQVIKVVRTKHTRDLSLGMFIIFCFGVSLWLVYGILVSSISIIVANAVTVVSAFIILVYKLRYG